MVLFPVAGSRCTLRNYEETFNTFLQKIDQIKKICKINQRFEVKQKKYRESLVEKHLIERNLPNPNLH